jgi:hypothetical protein
VAGKPILPRLIHDDIHNVARERLAKYSEGKRAFYDWLKFRQHINGRGYYIQCPQTVSISLIYGSYRAKKELKKKKCE